MQSQSILTKKFVSRWNNCHDCSLHLLSREHVIGKGDLPCEVFFIGEAPGRVEDLLGRPFVGPSGHLLKKQIAAVEELLGRSFKRYVTNIVACAPWADDARSKTREPSLEESKACSPRLNELVKLAQPKTIIFIGQVAKKFFKPPKGMPTLTILHPSAILQTRLPPTSCVAYAQVIHRLHEHLREVLEG
jgi:uracil-DNA glycosylase family 4